MDIVQARTRQAIENSNKSYRQIGEETGIAHSTISRYMSGKGDRIPADKITALAKACHVSPTWLLGIDDKPDSLKAVPVLGDIACGVPASLGEYEGEHILIPSDEDADYAIICHGESMRDIGIYDGDRALIRQQSDVDDGEIAAVLIDNETTLKRVFRPMPGLLVLHAENAAMKDLIYKGEELECIRILGKLISVNRRY